MPSDQSSATHPAAISAQEPASTNLTDSNIIMGLFNLLGALAEKLTG